jgi:hypothetical protein
MRLLDWVKSLPLVDRVSRIVIEPGPGRCVVVATIASWRSGRRLDAASGEPVRRGPVSVDDAEGMAQLRPEITLDRHDREPDATGWIGSADLPGQIQELRASGIVGGLNVERLGSRKTVISTHAATQQERSAWLANKGA